MVGGVDAMIVLIAVVSRRQAYLAALTAILGSLVGSLILFLIARKGGEEYHRRHTSSARGNRLRAWFHEYGLLTVFVPAFVPIIPLPLKIFIISAGALEESPLNFLHRAAGRARSPLSVPGLAWIAPRHGHPSFPAPAYLGADSSGIGFICCTLRAVRIIHDRRLTKSRPSCRQE